MPLQDRVLVLRDFMLETSLDDISDELRSRGYHVERGPQIFPSAEGERNVTDLSPYLHDIDVVLSTNRTKLSKELLASAKRLKGIVYPAIGTESVDLEAANDCTIIVAHGPTPENFNALAEASVMLILSLMYDLNGTQRILRENLARPTEMRARMLKGKMVGIVGFGRIGRGVAERLQNWDVDVVVYSRHLDSNKLPAHVRGVPLDELLSVSDVVSLHATLTNENRHLLNERRLRLMKRTAYLVNTARGGLIDEAALVRVLRNEEIAGAALDTFEHEPLDKEHPLRTLPNVMLTPHMVGLTREIFDAIPVAAIENVTRILRGVAPLYCKNPELLPLWQQRVGA
ncbi:2-hydroxyacid dehydrogenase [Paraburkholderia caribensis]|uniref:2-hydroxyacid dehydrogenase n=1 Tax=Paraburkholderia caribensis TaxID=75105 RepID=UPI001CB5188A|nr:2-hydroxyacid dehydrogenase [Paraburkholderia caribensis]CAG9263112.1 Lactate dehydrogenase-like oxidoreductase [Paraburkholderia caribensis]